MLRSVLLSLVPVSAVCVFGAAETRMQQEAPAPAGIQSESEKSMQVHYLEFVTPDVDATCSTLEKLHGVTFAEPDATLGNARTAALNNGGRIGVRAPMRETEEPVVRTYLLVDDIEAAVESAGANGGEIAMPATEVPGGGRFAIYLQGGNQFGLWQP